MAPAPQDGIEPLGDSLAALMFILILAMVVAPFAVGLLGGLLPEGAWNSALSGFGLLVQETVLLGLTLKRFQRFGLHWSDVRPLVETGAQAVRGIAWGVGLLFINGMSAQFSAAVIHVIAGTETLKGLLEREQAAVMQLLDPSAGTWRLGFIVFMAVGVAPIVEELFFRGYAYRVLKAHTGRHALWLSALLFASVHLYVVNFLPVFLLGLVLGLLYERSGGLAVPIVAHATVNGLVAVLTVTISRSIG